MALRTGGMRFLAGVALALSAILLTAEFYLRLWPPNDLALYLGEASPLTGPYVPHPVWGYTYRGFDVFRELYREEFEAFGRWDGREDTRPIWAFFGNSFVQAPGMLADTAAAALPSYRMFYLKRNERLELRLAQIGMLLAHGFEPQRIIIALLPIDCTELGRMPLQRIHVTSNGALTFTPSRPPLVPQDASFRLPLAAWVRTGRHLAYPSFRGRDLYRRMPPELLSDLRRLFQGVHRAALHRQTRVTVLLIPSWDIVVAGYSGVFFDVVGGMLRDEGLDVVDPRTAFLAAADRPGLYAPDKHLSARGNGLLLNELLRHQGTSSASGAVEVRS